MLTNIDPLQVWRDTFGLITDVHEVDQTPPPETYVEGLRAIEEKITPRQRQIFEFLYKTPGHAASPADMPHIHKKHGVLNADFARLAKEFCLAQGFRPVFRSEDDNSIHDMTNMRWRYSNLYPLERWRHHKKGDVRHWAVWANGFYSTRRKFYWVLHDAVVIALEELGWCEDTAKQLPNDAQTWEPAGLFSEGRMFRMTQIRRERSPVARRKCIERFGYVCQVCFESLEEKYGSAATTVIHVHHREELHLAGQRLTDPYEDLVTVCPNCHAVIHSRQPAYEPDEVRQMIAKQKSLS